MENKDIRISIKAIWILVIGSAVLAIVGAFFKVLQWEFSQVLMTIGLILFFSSWIIIMSDIIKHKIYNKTFWIMSMFIIPYISLISYLVQRNRLIRLGNKFGYLK